MNWEILLQAIQTVAVLVGVVFGLIQLRQIRTQREVQAGIELLRPLQAPETAEALMLVHALPDNLTSSELRARLGEHYGATVGVLALFESLGPLVARGHVPVDMYSEFYRGVTVLCWRKTSRFIHEQRAAGWPNLFEWLQWLAERMEERRVASGEVPAFERFATWKDSGDYDALCTHKRRVS